LERHYSADTDFRYRAAGRTVTGQGKIQHGSTFKIEATAVGRGGSIRASREAPLLELTACDQVTIHVKIHVSGEPAIRTVKIPRQESDLRQAHVAEHQLMFQRVALHLQPTSTTCEAKTTDRMVHDAFLGQPTTELFERMFDMGRYLLMASSRTGSLPPHLQGIWNNQLHPPWQSDWHLDMNVQMNYWLAETCHLSSSTRPLFRWIASLIPDGRENARKIWGCRGIVLPMACAGGGKMLPGPWVAWTGAAAWLAQHFWQHYQYTLDRHFLAREAYPFMKEAAAFYEDFLVKDDDGRYMVIPSLSPENTPAERGQWDQTKMMTINATMDIALVRELMENLLAASTLLRKDTAHQAVWRDILAHLPDWPVDKDGMLKEWERPENLDNQDYRHYAHLYPLFPGEAFSREQTPKLFEAAAKAVHAREACGYASNAGWSYPYLALLHARLGEGDQALRCLTQLAKCSMMGNLLTIHNDWRFQGLTLYWPLGDRAFMIDAIFGAAAAVAEMLLQSQGGVIRILPALPKVWDQGQVRGLQARGAFEIDITWSAHRAQQVRIRSDQGQICRMSGIGSRAGLHVRCAGRTIPVQRHSHGIFSFPTTAGKTYVLQPS
ncbi:MAG: hypothetical protein IT440_07950, partial [Phycisphaeraceae bacterium]|nr:hypothetical protein [Phycisphaeraceae bacterium]